jgi:hypothetical protein
MNRIQHCLYGGATLQRDLLAAMQEAGDEKRETAIGKKIVRAMVKYGLWKTTDQDHLQLECWRREVSTALKKEHGTKQFDSFRIPTAAEFSICAFVMIGAWLRWGRFGEPGLCYYTDEARADLLTLLFCEEQLYGLGTRTHYYRKIRQRLGLKPAYARRPLVIKVRRVKDAPNLIHIESRWKQGTTRHTLCPTNPPLCINGRQLYPLVR